MAKKSGKNKGYSCSPTESGKFICREYFDMPDGTRKQLSATDTTEEKARRKLKNKYAKICKEGKKTKSKNYTLKAWFNYWLYTLMKPIFDAKESDTTSWYTRLSKKFIPVIGNKTLKQLKISDIQKVVNNMLEQKLSPKYIKEVCCLLSTCLNYACAEGYMQELDFEQVKRPEVKKKKKVIYGENETQILDDYFNGSDFDIKYLPIKVMYDIGLRPEEVGGLNWGDIDYLAQYLHIQRAYIIRDIFDAKGNKIGRKKVLKDTKSENGVRDIPIPMLTSNFREQQKYCMTKGYSIIEDEPIFRNCRGTRYNQETLRDLFKKLTEKLKITQLGCYVLRHGFAFSMIKCTDIETTRDLLGQEDIKTTQGYLQTNNNRKENAMKRLSESRNNKKDKNKLSA